MTRDEIERALDKIDVESYLDREGISYQTSYGTRGLQLNLNECPVCHGGGRKTYINAETGLGNCFHGACGFKFNKFKLVRAVSGLAGHELDEHIGSIAGDMGWMPKRERVEIVRGDLAMPSKCVPLPVGEQNLQYLLDRGVSIASCRWFNLSYCNGGWWGMTLQDGSKKWVSFDKRVIIPIADLQGKLVSFQGRDVTGKLEPKYLFPTGFAVSGSYIYNAHNFVDNETTHLILGEGAFDAIAIHQAIDGSPSCKGMLAGATFGMHLSGGPDGQIAKLLQLKERGLKTVTMMWDSERKAMAMAIKMGLQITGLGITVRIAQLPEGFDPAQGPTGAPTPPGVVRGAIFNATLLNRLSAIKLLNQSMQIA